MTWNHMEHTDNPGIRYCGGCERNVHLCQTDKELAQVIPDNHWVARRKKGTIPGPRHNDLSGMVVGEVSADYDAGEDRPKKE